MKQHVTPRNNTSSKVTPLFSLHRNHSDSCPCFGGHHQGSVLSPRLYDVFIDGPLRQMEACRDGITVSGMHIPALALAHDIVLGSDPMLGMQRLLDV
jgi:hypothetical protein